MTEYEHLILFLELLQTANGTMSNYMTLVFGMLVTSYMAAHRLDRGTSSSGHVRVGWHPCQVA